MIVKSGAVKRGMSESGFARTARSSSWNPPRKARTDLIVRTGRGDSRTSTDPRRTSRNPACYEWLDLEAAVADQLDVDLLEARKRGPHRGHTGRDEALQHLARRAFLVHLDPRAA